MWGTWEDDETAVDMLVIQKRKKTLHFIEIPWE